MRTTFKYTAGLALAGALMIAAATPSQARWHGAGAAAAGFAAGAIVGSAAANSYYYGPGYYDPGYAYDSAYAYDPGIRADYGYEADNGYYGWSFGPHANTYGANADTRHCGVSPASSQAGICSP